MNRKKFDPSEINDTRLIDVLCKTLDKMGIMFENKQGGVIFSEDLESETYLFKTLFLGLDNTSSKNAWVYSSGLKSRNTKSNVQRATGIIFSGTEKSLSQLFHNSQITRTSAA